MIEVRDITGNYEYEEICDQVFFSRKKISGTSPMSIEQYQILREQSKSNN